MKTLLMAGAALILTMALTACPPPEGEDAGEADRDAGVADQGQPDTAQADTAQADTLLPDTLQTDTLELDAAVPDTLETDAAEPDAAEPDAWCPEAGPAPLTEQARVAGLANSTVASSAWAFPTQYGMAVCGDEVARIEGAELAFYDRADLANGNATELQRLALVAAPAEDAGVEDAGPAQVISGIALAFDPETCDRLFFTYGKEDFSGGIGYVERDGASWGAPVLEAGALMTSTYFPMVTVSQTPAVEDAGTGAPEITFVAVDDVASNVRRLKSYSSGGGLVEDEPMTLANCSGQPAELFLDAPYALVGPFVAVAYTGSFFSADEGKAGFFVFDTSDPGASACRSHVALPAGTETDSHVAVGGMAVRNDADVVVGWDHYGGGYPAPRYDSKILVYQIVAGPSVVAATPDAEAPLSAVWPSGVFYLGGGETLVVQSPPSCAFVAEVFDLGLSSLGKVHGPDATSYTQYFRSVAFGSVDLEPRTPFWLSQPDGLVLYSRP